MDSSSCNRPRAVQFFLFIVIANCIIILALFWRSNLIRSSTRERLGPDKITANASPKIDDLDQRSSDKTIQNKRHEKFKLNNTDAYIYSTKQQVQKPPQNLKRLEQKPSPLQLRYQFDCESILLDWGNFSLYSQTNGSVGPKPSKDRGPSTSSVENWCGRPPGKYFHTLGSFSSISEWLRSSGINVVDLLYQTGVPCRIKCPLLQNKGPIRVHEIYGRGIHAIHELHHKLEQISPRLSRLEMDILRDTFPVHDFNLISNEHTSKVTVLHPKGDIYVGDTISVRVDVYNGYGKAKTSGGDEVRIWIGNATERTGCPGKVVDLGNGSYVGTVTVRWPGIQELSVVLHHPKESIRTMVFLRHVLGTMRYLTASFTSGGEEETTLCMWHPKIPGYNDVCNLTSQNGGLPWYCGKPYNDYLTCADWFRSLSSSFVFPLPVTKAEQLALDKLNREPYLRKITFPGSHLNVKDSTPTLSVKPCNRVPHALTWKEDTPSGWFFKETWHSSICKADQLTLSDKRKWLGNKTVYVLGDSNSRKLFEIMRRDFCTVNAPQEPPFPGPMNCSDPERQIALHFRAHAHPFNLPHPDHFRKYNVPLYYWLSEIPKDEDVLVILHLYLHFSQFTIPLYMLHVKDALRGVTELLKRNPRARFVLRGTHVSYKGWPVHAAGGDYLAYHFDQALRREFSPLKDDVMYLNGWDMTLAVGNLNFHPDPFVDEAMVDQIFNHFVGR